jgi:ASC-1-like (ASCH) protein
MARIEKKVWPEYFSAVLSGKKNFEVRLADWSCKPGDTLVLREFDPKKGYTGRSVEKEVNFVFNTKEMTKFFPKEDIEKFGFMVLGFK